MDYGKGLSKMASESRSVNPTAAAIMARVICPERNDWPPQAARDFLGMRFPDPDLDRFHGLLAGHYTETLTVAEQEELERYLFVNCLLTMIHDRARRSLAETKDEA